MKTKRLTTFLALLTTLALPLAARGEPHSYQRKIPRTLAAFPSCGDLTEGDLVIVSDASTRYDCDATPEVNPANWTPALCICSGGSRIAAADIDLSTYAPLTALAAYAPLAGADFTGPVTMVADVDEPVKITGADGLVVSVTCEGEPVECYFSAKSGDVALSVGPTEVTILGPNSTEQVTVSDSSILLAVPDGVITFSTGSAPSIATTAGCVAMGAIGAQVLYCGVSADAPYACAGGSSPIGYFTDSTGPDLCYCNGSAWTPVDGSGTCSTAG